MVLSMADEVVLGNERDFRREGLAVNVERD